jgi:hypothetical protein
MAMNLTGYCPFLIVIFVFLVWKFYQFSKNVWQGPTKSKYQPKGSLIASVPKGEINHRGL